MKCKRCHKEAMPEYSICRDCFGKKINPKNNSYTKSKGGKE